MTVIDGEKGICICDRCGVEYLHSDDHFNFWFVFVGKKIFYRRHKPHFPDLCIDCCKKIIPLVYALRDVDELKLYVNKLGKAISEKRKQRTKDHWTTASNAR